MIKVVFFDIDGVLTNGKMMVDDNGREYKTLDFRDIDAIYDLYRKGYVLGFITGEDTPIVQFFKNRLPHHYFFAGCKNKLAKVKEVMELVGVTAEEVCYIGDSKHDLEVIQFVGFGVAPKNGHDVVKSASRLVLQTAGGDGAVQELAELLELQVKKEHF